MAQLCKGLTLSGQFHAWNRYMDAAYGYMNAPYECCCNGPPGTCLASVMRW